MDQLRALLLEGMAEAFLELQTQDATTELSHSEWLGLLVEREIASRDIRRFQTRMCAAKLRRIGVAIEDVDFRTPRRLDRALFQQLATERWIADARMRSFWMPKRAALARSESERLAVRSIDGNSL